MRISTSLLVAGAAVALLACSKSKNAADTTSMSGMTDTTAAPATTTGTTATDSMRMRDSLNRSGTTPRP